MLCSDGCEQFHLLLLFLEMTAVRDGMVNGLPVSEGFPRGLRGLQELVDFMFRSFEVRVPTRLRIRGCWYL